MNEQEAFEAWWASSNTVGMVTTAEAGWNAALAWLRSQGEPVAWMYERDGMVHDGMYPPIFLQSQRPLCRDEDWTETPLYLAPRAIENDDREYLSAIAHLGRAMRRLVIAARTSGGTAGPDAELMAACAQAEDAMSVGAIGRAMAVPQPAIPDGWQSVAARDVLSERRRQMEKEGWTLANDDEHRDGSMAQAAACYALGAATDNPDRHVMDRFGIEGTPYHIHSLWPWDRKWFKPHSRRRDLVKAGALILAEIERLDRRMLVTAPEPSK